MQLRVKEFVEFVTNNKGKYEKEVLGVQVFDRFDDMLVYDGPAEWIETTQEGVFIIAHDVNNRCKYDRKVPPALPWSDLHGIDGLANYNHWKETHTPEAVEEITVGKLKELIADMDDDKVLKARIADSEYRIVWEDLVGELNDRSPK